MSGEQFRHITIRGRVAYAICCLENAIQKLDDNKLDWSPLLELLWRYPTCYGIQGLTDWFDNEGECIAFCIMDELPFDECGFEFITQDKHKILEELYSKVDKSIWKLTDLIHGIGTQYLYSGVREGAPETLKLIDEILMILDEKNIDYPNLSNFEQFQFPINPETDWIVWGDKIESDQLSIMSSWLRDQK